MANGIKVAKKGKSLVTSNTDSNVVDTGQKDLIFNTQLNTFRYTKKGKIRVNSVPVSVTFANPPTYSVAHDLGYTPSYLYYTRNIKTGEIKQANYDAGSNGPAVVSYSSKNSLTFLAIAGEYNSTTSDSTDGFDIIYYIGADNLDEVDS